jgi:cytochrome c oxidase assembly protein subunit 11
MDDRLRRRNRITMIAAFGVVAGMVALTFAAVPLYDLFCRVTGYAGTPRVATAASGVVGERQITVRFDASVNGHLDWRFAPKQGPMAVKVGETALAFYSVQNRSDGPTVGTATFNVTPAKAAKYVNKMECFCFTEQRLEAGQSADMAVSFFIDPAIVENHNVDDVNTITLSYTFFPKDGTTDGRVAARTVADNAAIR